MRSRAQQRGVGPDDACQSLTRDTQLRTSGAAAAGRQHRRRRPRTAVRSAEHARYIMEVGVASQPESIGTLLKVLELQGQQVVSPDQRAGLHPLAIPLASGPAPAGADGDASVFGDTSVTCLLRWPACVAANDLPVVRMSPGAPALTLLARSSEEFLRRALAEEDAAGGAGPLADALGPAAASFYQPGAVAASGLPSLGAWLTRQGSMFPDVVEGLVAAHLEKGDKLSAMITAEWYMKRQHFPGWGRPYEFAASLLSALGRADEGRDSARIALCLPWWSLQSGFAAAAAAAGMPADPSEVRRRLGEASRAAQKSGGLPPGVAVPETAEQVAIEEAEWLLNLVAAGQASWDGIRPELADKYALGGQPSIADFIRAAG